MKASTLAFIFIICSGLSLLSTGVILSQKVELEGEMESLKKQLKLVSPQDANRSDEDALVQAYAWLNIARANGNKKAEELIQEIELTPEQLIEAQSLSTEIQKRTEANGKD